MAQAAYAIRKREFSLIGLILGLVAAVGIGVGLGIAYALFTQINPFIYFGFVGAIAAGLICGFSVLKVLGRLGVSSVLTSVTCGSVALFVLLWTYYTLWLNMEQIPPWSEFSVIELIKLGPLEPFRFSLIDLSPYYSYSISRRSLGNGADMGSSMTMIYWIVDLLLISVPAIALSFAIDEKLINPNTGNTLESVDSLTIASPDDKQAFQKALALQDFSGFKPLEIDWEKVNAEGPFQGARISASRIQWYEDKADTDAFALSVFDGGFVFDKDDGWKEEYEEGLDDAIVAVQIVTRAERDGILKLIRA